MVLLLPWSTPLPAPAPFSLGQMTGPTHIQVVQHMDVKLGKEQSPAYLRKHLPSHPSSTASPLGNRGGFVMAQGAPKAQRGLNHSCLQMPGGSEGCFPCLKVCVSFSWDSPSSASLYVPTTLLMNFQPLCFVPFPWHDSSSPAESWLFCVLISFLDFLFQPDSVVLCVCVIVHLYISRAESWVVQSWPWPLLMNSDNEGPDTMATENKSNHFPWPCCHLAPIIDIENSRTRLKNSQN